MARLWCTSWNVHSAASSMIWNKMSWGWHSTDEAEVKSNTYSCKTGSLCDSGRTPAENSTHSARAHTPGHNGRQLTNREWEKHSEMSKNKRTQHNRKLEQTADYILCERTEIGLVGCLFHRSSQMQEWVIVAALEVLKYSKIRHIMVASQHGLKCSK